MVVHLPVACCFCFGCGSSFAFSGGTSSGHPFVFLTTVSLAIRARSFRRTELPNNITSPTMAAFSNCIPFRDKCSVSGGFSSDFMGASLADESEFAVAIGIVPLTTRVLHGTVFISNIVRLSFIPVGVFSFSTV